MSKYTTELRFICESLAGLTESEGENSVDVIVEKAAPKIFDPFDIFDEGYRLSLETKILRHFYTREIGYETFGLWKLHFNNRIREIMPRFNVLYRAALSGFDPLGDVDVTTTRNESGERNESANGSESGNYVTNTTAKTTEVAADKTDTSSDSTDAGNKKTVTKVSDTPQGALAGLEADKYMSGASITSDTTSNTTHADGSAESESTTNTDSTTQTTNEDTRTRTDNRNVGTTAQYVERVVGKRGTTTYASMVKELVESFVSVDELLMRELNDLFMLVW